jgi:hypothetical protein
MGLGMNSAMGMGISSGMPAKIEEESEPAHERVLPA